MTDYRPEERLIIMYIFDSLSYGHGILKKLEKKLDDLEIQDYFNLELRKFRNEKSAGLGIKQLKPVLCVIQLKLWKDPIGGFKLLEHCLPSISREHPFYSILYGKNFNSDLKTRSETIREQDQFHLGTCSSRMKDDNMLLNKITGVLIQDEQSTRLEHLETSPGKSPTSLVNAILEQLNPLSESLIQFKNGDGKCFEKKESLVLGLEDELKRLRAYYNELFKLFIQKRDSGDPVDSSITEAFSGVSQFLSDGRSPLLQFVNWIRVIPPGDKSYFVIYQFLERKIGDYQIDGYCMVFQDRFGEFKDNLRKIEEYLNS